MEKFGLLSDTEATLAALVLDSAYKCRDIFPENKRLDQVFSIMNILKMIVNVLVREKVRSSLFDCS